MAIDSGDGSVYRLDYQYDEDVTFASSAGIVGETAALAAWAGTYDTVLAYRLVPRPLESGDETEARLMELGLTHFYELRLTYALEREERYLGIDAAGVRGYRHHLYGPVGLRGESRCGEAGPLWRGL